jgi:hypothetical protein
MAKFEIENPKFRISCLRRGSVYLMVLALSMMVTVMGLASLFAVRVQRRAAQITKDCAEARLCAQSAVELGLLFVKDQSWRTTWPNGTWLSDKSLGNGSYSLEGIDPQDGDLSDSQYDPLILTGTGIKDIACHKTQVLLVPVVEPLEALNTCIHTSGQFKVTGGHLIRAVGAPISTNGVLDNDGTIDGDADANSVDTMDTITGILTVPAAQKPMPDPDVISDYINKATVIPFPGGTIDEQVLAPSYNPWGATNADGLYFIDTGDTNLTIKNTRIHGTLIVRLGTKKLTLDDAVFVHNYRSDYPVLIVDGDAEIKHHSCDLVLSEASNSTNYNPSGAPYQGQSDADMVDEYPNEVQGLIHITGSLELSDTARIKGAIICEGSVECASQNTIIHDPSLYATPPEGYTYVDHMKISPGSYKQVVE